MKEVSRLWKGYDDGFYNRGYNDSCTVNHESSIYREGYKSGYAEQYKIAYEKEESHVFNDWKRLKNLGEKEGQLLDLTKEDMMV